MKILYHHRTQGRGAEGTHIRGIVDAFRGLGFIVDILSPPGIDPYEDTGPVKHASSGKGKAMALIAERTPQVMFELMEIAYNFLALLQLTRKLRRNRYSFLYARYSLYGFAPVLAARNRAIPVVLEINDSIVIERSRPLLMKCFARWIETFCVKNASALITISGVFRRRLLESYELKSGGIEVMPNAVDPKRFTQDLQPITRHDLGIQQKHVIGVVGAFVPWHGLDFMLRSLHGILKSRDLHVLLVGDGPVRAGIERQITQLGIDGYVTLTGFVNAALVPSYVGVMDICAMPGSNPHGSPVKIFEYMACGKAIVAANYGPIAEVLEQGVDGWLFPPGDEEAFRQAVCRLLYDDDLRVKMGNQARKKVFQQFTWERNAQRVLRMVETYSPCGTGAWLLTENGRNED
jgi:glycosyltransferase involved in cell wall biosynthesis